MRNKNGRYSVVFSFFTSEKNVEHATECNARKWPLKTLKIVRHRKRTANEAMIYNLAFAIYPLTCSSDS